MEIAPGDPSIKENRERIKLRILVAEDNPALQRMYRLVLEAKGYEIEIVDNGRLLLEKLSEEGETFDMVITDYQMPEKDGITALGEIRSIDRFRKFPVIVLTSLGDVPGVQKSIDDLGAVCITKPFSPRELYAKIEEMTKTETESA